MHSVSLLGMLIWTTQMIQDRYGLDATNDKVESSRFTRAIQNGVEDGTFALPKGPSGKVKLAPKPKPEPTNEVCASHIAGLL